MTRQEVRVSLKPPMPEIAEDVHVDMVEWSASDQMVARSARVSTTGLDSRDQDPENVAGLINYLMRDRHGSPFEHNSMTFLIKAPIFVFREFHRHRAGWSYNEESARYREMEGVFYRPAADRPLVQRGKPGAYEFVPGTDTQTWSMQYQFAATYRQVWQSYQTMLKDGVAREVARMVLPVGLYSTMYATCNARSLMHFLSLRTKDERAAVQSFPQHEIEMVARGMEELWATLMPATYEAFNKHGRIAP